LSVQEAIMARHYSAAVTSKGQVTIPAAVRRELGIAVPSRVTFTVSDDGEVALESSRFSTLESLVGAFGKLDRELSWEEMLDIAHAEAYREKLKGTDG
jgi:AbrB family looped-hinge helix DNA binding protein